jgi:histone acetyltransferase SAS3
MTMSSARAAEDELQQSVLLSAEDAEYETADQGNDDSTKRAESRARGVNGDAEASGSDSSLGDPEDAESEDRDASGEEVEDDIDASGDDEIDLVPQHPQNGVTDDGGSEESESEDGDEAVGAVKSRESLSDESDQDSEVSSHQSAVEDDSDEAPWEQDDDAGEDDDDSETAQANVCFFCKQDEENDPGEDFEAFLTCRVCKNHGKLSPRFCVGVPKANSL